MSLCLLPSRIQPHFENRLCLLLFQVRTTSLASPTPDLSLITSFLYRFKSLQILHPPFSVTLPPAPCHGLCSVTFFPKNNRRMALMESPMMATLPLFSATVTTGHPHRTYIGAPSEYFLHSDTTNKPAFLSLSLPTSTMCYLLQHNQSPTMLHTCSMFQANHIAHAPVLEVMGLGHHKDLRGFESAPFGVRVSSLYVHSTTICSPS